MGTTIPIAPRIRDRLKTYGHAGDTYNDILTRLMDEIDRESFIGQIRKRARENTEWIDLEDL